MTRQGTEFKMAAVKNMMVYLVQIQHLVLWMPQVKALIVWLIFVLGSFIHDFYPLPASYFSSRKNIFNVVFVKRGWGWTCGLLFLFICLDLVRRESELQIIGKNLLRLFYGTCTWYLVTTSFEQIEHLTGHCDVDTLLASKTECSHAGYTWEGFDISGHCFLLTFCILLINDEIFTFASKSTTRSKSSEITYTKDHGQFHHTLLTAMLNLVSVFLTVLMILWEIMLFFTCSYFHTVHQKLIGTLTGIGAWYLIYKVAVKHKHPFLPIAPFYHKKQ